MKRQTKEADVWQEVDPEEEIMENLFGDGDELYKDAKEYKGFSLGM